MKDSPPSEIDEADVQRLIERVQHGRLEHADRQQIVALLQTLVWLQRTLASTRISLSKLKRILFGEKTEKRPRKPKNPDGGEPGGASGSTEGNGSNGPPSGTPPSQSGKPSSESNPSKVRGHGRRAAADYVGAETVFCPHPEHHSGDQCEKCLRGRLYRSRPLVRLRFSAQPLALATRYELEQLRCNGCGALTVAPMPVEAGRETYAVALKVNLALAHYHLGSPQK